MLELKCQVECEGCSVLRNGRDPGCLRLSWAVSVAGGCDDDLSVEWPVDGFFEDDCVGTWLDSLSKMGPCHAYWLAVQVKGAVADSDDLGSVGWKFDGARVAEHSDSGLVLEGRGFGADLKLAVAEDDHVLNVQADVLVIVEDERTSVDYDAYVGGEK